MTRWVLALLLLAPLAQAEEPESYRWRLALYGAPGVLGDGGSTLWARSRGAVELHPLYQDQGVMMAAKFAQAAVLAWLDGRLPPALRWVLRGAALGWHAYLTVHNFRLGPR